MKFQEIQKSFEDKKKLLNEEINAQVEQLLRLMFSEIKTPITAIKVSWRNGQGKAYWYFKHEPYDATSLPGYPSKIKNSQTALRDWIEGWGAWVPNDFAQHHEKLQEIARILDWWVSETGGKDITL